MPDLDATVTKALASALRGAVPTKIGVAVSGGGDSMALLDLLRRWGDAELFVASVDHGLRAEAAQEIALVSDYAARHGMRHDVLSWEWDGKGNLQASARDGRRDVLRAWATQRGITHVALGHTADDQAETFLMRLARGSGVDGLAGMAEERREGDLTWLRPLLGVRRDALRAHLRASGLVWADDPSNDDPRFDRVKARQVMDALAPLGLTVDRLVQTAYHMAREKAVLSDAAASAKAALARVEGGDVVLDRDGFSALPEATALRILADGLCFVSGETYRPRFKALQAAIADARDTALHGCLILWGRDHVRMTREWRAVSEHQTEADAVWDGRWRLSGPSSEGCEVAALGEEGLRMCPDWRDTGLPRRGLLASPAVWQGERLIAAPLAGFGAGWCAQLIAGRDVFG